MANAVGHAAVEARAEGSVVLYSVADNYADSKYPKSAYGHVSALYVGNSYDHAQNIWGSERIYIRFNLSSVPEGKWVLAATLRLWQYYPPASPQEYETHRVLGEWKERVQTWNDQPEWNAEKTSSTVAPSQTEVAVEWDITADVRAWYSGEASNYGTMIKVAKEEHMSDASSGFWSKEYPVQEWKPRLTITLGDEPPTTLTQTTSEWNQISGLTDPAVLSMLVVLVAAVLVGASLIKRSRFPQ